MVREQEEASDKSKEVVLSVASDEDGIFQRRSCPFSWSYYFSGQSVGESGGITRAKTIC